MVQAGFTKDCELTDSLVDFFWGWGEGGGIRSELVKANFCLISKMHGRKADYFVQREIGSRLDQTERSDLGNGFQWARVRGLLFQ